MIERLLDMLAAHYGITNASVQPFGEGWIAHTYYVDRMDGPPLVVRVRLPEQGLSLPHEVLLFLEDRGYAAPRVVRTLEGAALAGEGDEAVLLTTFVQGAIGEYTVPALYELGQTIGRLHALPVTRSSLPMAEMLPPHEGLWVEAKLIDLADRVPPELWSEYDELLVALRGLPSVEHLPRVLIHNDCHPGNAVSTPSREVVLIDWDGAGLGPAVIDIGFLLMSVGTPAPWSPFDTADPAWVTAVIDGYARHHCLSPDELNLLADAIRFRAIIYGAAAFAHYTAQGEPRALPPWWRVRYEGADGLAERARHQFAQHI